jgi:two-component system, response regulator YesN
MIKLLIVDDEEEIRSGIRDIIDWESNDICVCGEASNGVEALKLIDELSPDILLIDIRMPVKNGLEVIEAIAERKLSVRSIVLSGYDDFSYAQKSMKFGASDYLLKPCRPQEILDTVLKVKASIELENNKKKVYENLKIHFNKTLPVLKEKYLTRMITPEKKRLDKVQEDFLDLQIGLELKSFAVIVERIDRFSVLCESNNSKDIELFKFAVKNITEEILGAEYKCEVFEYNNDLVTIVNVYNQECISTISALANDIKTNISKLLGFSVSIGIGRYYEDINNIHLSYNEALKSIEAVFFMGPDSVIKYEDIFDCFESEACYPVNEEKEILQCIKLGNTEKLVLALDEFFNALCPEKLLKDHLIRSCTALALSLYHLCIEMNIETGNTFSHNFSFLSEIQKLENLEQLKIKLYKLSETIAEKVNSKKGGNKIIDSALKFINENYSSDLSLETVAKNVYITSGYLSLLFKQVVGVNFVDYLHKVRIEKACETLKNFRFKTYEVSSKVGYSDEKYFTQIFKKYTGMTPTQYRDSNA